MVNQRILKKPKGLILCQVKGRAILEFLTTFAVKMQRRSVNKRKQFFPDYRQTTPLPPAGHNWDGLLPNPPAELVSLDRRVDEKRQEFNRCR